MVGVVGVGGAFREGPESEGLHAYEQYGENQRQHQRTPKWLLSFMAHVMPTDMKKPAAKRKEQRAESKGCRKPQVFRRWRAAENCRKSCRDAETNGCLNKGCSEKTTSDQTLIFSPAGRHVRRIICRKYNGVSQQVWSLSSARSSPICWKIRMRHLSLLRNRQEWQCPVKDRNSTSVGL